MVEELGIKEVNKVVLVNPIQIRWLEGFRYLEKDGRMI